MAHPDRVQAAGGDKLAERRQNRSAKRLIFLEIDDHRRAAEEIRRRRDLIGQLAGKPCVGRGKTASAPSP